MSGCLGVWVYGCICVSVYVCMCVCVYGCMCVCVYVCMYVVLHACMYVGTYVCMYVVLHACMYVGTYVRMYECNMYLVICCIKKVHILTMTGRSCKIPIFGVSQSTLIRSRGAMRYHPIQTSEGRCRPASPW